MKTMNGQVLKRLFISGANNLYNHYPEVDALNVFPVPDGDTGSNMLHTIASVAKAISAVPDDAPVGEDAIKYLELDDEVIDFDSINGDVYLVADDGKNRSIYSKTFYAHQHFDSDFTYSVTEVSDKEVEIHIKANKFVKALYIHFKDNYKYIFSDNYIDLEKGQECSINVTCKDSIDLSTLKLEAFKG